MNLLNKLIELLIRIKMRTEPEWVLAIFEVDKNTRVHIVIERFKSDRWEFEYTTTIIGSSRRWKYELYSERSR